MYSEVGGERTLGETLCEYLLRYLAADNLRMTSYHSLIAHPFERQINVARDSLITRG